MYMIEDRGIINLALYPRFNIIEHNNVYRLCAFTNLETDHEIKQNDNFRKEGLTLMTFENEVDAEYALWARYGKRLKKTILTNSIYLKSYWKLF